jgi:hypothetical protein
MAKQSNAYAAKAIAITASRIGLIRRICNQLCVSQLKSGVCHVVICRTPCEFAQKQDMVLEDISSAAREPI